MGDAGRQWDHTADSKRKGTAAFPAPPLQAVEARAGTQGDQHSGPQSPHPSAEREAVWPICSHQGVLSEGAAGWRADAPAPVEGGGLGQCAFLWRPHSDRPAAPGPVWGQLRSVMGDGPVDVQ